MRLRTTENIQYFEKDFPEDKDQIEITGNRGRGMGLQIFLPCPNYPLTKKRGELRFNTEKIC